MFPIEQLFTWYRWLRSRSSWGSWTAFAISITMINITKIQRDIPERINSRRHTSIKESHAILRLANSHVPLTAGRLRSHDRNEKLKKAIGLKKNIKCLLLPIGICRTVEERVHSAFRNIAQLWLSSCCTVNSALHFLLIDILHLDALNTSVLSRWSLLTQLTIFEKQQLCRKSHFLVLFSSRPCTTMQRKISDFHELVFPLFKVEYTP